MEASPPATSRTRSPTRCSRSTKAAASIVHGPERARGSCASFADLERGGEEALKELAGGREGQYEDIVKNESSGPFAPTRRHQRLFMNYIDNVKAYTSARR